MWTSLDLAKYWVEKGYELVSDETISRAWHRLDFRVLRSVLSINSPDEEYETKAAHLRECQQLPREGKMILLYEDEIYLTLMSGIIRCWTRRSNWRKILMPSQNVKRYDFGAVHFLTGRLTYQVGDHKNSDGFLP